MSSIMSSIFKMSVTIQLLFFIFFELCSFNFCESKEVLSDLATIPTDRRSALDLEVRATSFWSTVQTFSEDMNLEKHLRLYEDVEKGISELNDNSHPKVKNLLAKALESLKRADGAALTQRLKSMGVASAELTQILKEDSGPLIGGEKSYVSKISKALGESVGNHIDEVHNRLVEDRYDTFMPMLREARKAQELLNENTNLVDDLCQELLNLDFTQKYVNHEYLGEVPKFVQEVGWGLRDAAQETRHGMMKFLMAMMASLIGDVMSPNPQAPAEFVKDIVGKGSSSDGSDQQEEKVQEELNSGEDSASESEESPGLNLKISEEFPSLLTQKKMVPLAATSNESQSGSCATGYAADDFMEAEAEKAKAESDVQDMAEEEGEPFQGL
eukprot:TRINITY_DN41599_c0_g1_i1.p1 TRINITY_DN41599_c0_g1~~TRINITY_DN41599_c0_g1_i1.p1  ORF type:complete len:385 (-),score=95.61 TRINITY_DN41599_c0_g1_i1:42-1196(-)